MVKKLLNLMVTAILLNLFLINIPGLAQQQIEAIVSFPAVPNLSNVEVAIQTVWVPSFVAQVIWGYRVYVDGKFYADMPAVYTPIDPNAYQLGSPQSISITISGNPGYHHVKIIPLGIFYTPNLVTCDSRKYAFKKTGPNVFLWDWTDPRGNPISSWEPLSEIPYDYLVRCGHDYPGYYEINSVVFNGYVEFKAYRYKEGGGER